MNPDILDGQGQPIPKRVAEARRFLRWAGRTWKVWVPIGISILALGISAWSATVSSRNSEVTRKLAKLDFRPSLRLGTMFKSPGETPPFWTLTNTGPVEAVQVEVEMKTHWYFAKQDRIAISGSGSQTATSIPQILPQESRSYAFPKGWLDTNAILYDPPQSNMLEIVLTYRRPQDLAEYSESAYYFVSPDGSWVGELNGSVRGEPYESMRIALSRCKEFEQQLPHMDWADPLHPNE